MKDHFNNAVGPQVRSSNGGSNGRSNGRGNFSSKLIPALAVLTMGAGLQAATQFFARSFHYQTALGTHFNFVYPPWAILIWAGKWFKLYPDAFMHAGSIGVIGTGFGMIGLLVARTVSSNSSRTNDYLHGSARWANEVDIRAAGLMPRSRTILDRIIGKEKAASRGVYVGAWIDQRGRQHYLRHNGPEHVLCYAPTRSGKGVGLVVPTLLSWGESAVITDLKGELWALSAGWRQRHAKNKVLRFEPAVASGSVCWNPLAEIRAGTENEVGDVQNLVTLIVDPDGKGLESHWQKTSQALLVGVILHALYKSKIDGVPATLPGVDAMMSDPQRDIAELWMEMVTYLHVDEKNHPVVGSAARDMMDRPDEEAGSVLSTAKSYLALYRDPIVARNVGRSDFKIRDLMHHTSPVSLYIITQPNDKARLRPLVRVMVNMIVRLLADKMDFEGGRSVAHYQHRLLMMMDEFPSLGKLDILQESLAFVSGYGIKCYLICQDINQLRSRETGYGHDESITSNCHIQVAYPPNRIETAEHLSKLTGQTTVTKEQVTISGRHSGALLGQPGQPGQVSRTIQQVQRPLLTPDECLRMPGPTKQDGGDIAQAGDMVIYVAGYPAIYGKQALYFKDPVFQARASIPAPTVSDRLQRLHDTDSGKGITL